MALLVSGKSLGSKRKLFADFSIPIEPQWLGDDGVTLRGLITATVTQQVSAYEKRQADKQFIRALTTKDISAGIKKGKEQKDLDAQLFLNQESTITFIRLTLLAGG